MIEVYFESGEFPGFHTINFIEVLHSCTVSPILCYLNSFSARGNIEHFANNAYSGESARNELSHPKPALFSCEL